MPNICGKILPVRYSIVITPFLPTNKTLGLLEAATIYLAQPLQMSVDNDREEEVAWESYPKGVC